MDIQELNNLCLNFRYIGGNFPAKFDTVLQPDVRNFKILLNSRTLQSESFFYFILWQKSELCSEMNDRDIAICGEALVEEPYRLKIRSTERSQAWESIAENLNAMPSLKFSDSAVCA